MIANKKNSWIVNFTVPANHTVKLKESEKKDKYLDLAREMKKTKQNKTKTTEKQTIEHEGDGDTNCNWSARKNLDTWRDLLSLKLTWETIG